jgi:hypothetical protein
MDVDTKSTVLSMLPSVPALPAVVGGNNAVLETFPELVGRLAASLLCRAQR